jgi:hypothetical protein
VPEQRPRRPEQGPHRAPALPGERVTRRPVRHREHEVRVPGVGRQQRGGERVVVGHRQPADDVPAVDGAAARHIQGAAGDPDVAGRGLSQRGGDEGRGGHRRAGQHGTVVEEGVHPLAQAGVEDPHHQPQLRVELLCPQRGMEVAQVVLAKQGERLGGVDPGSMTRTRGSAAIRGP